MGLLADVYSYGDSLKRKVGGLLSDPRGTLDQFVGQLGDDMNRNSGLMNQAGYLPTDKQQYTPQQQAAARQQLGDIGANMAIAGMFVGKGAKTWDAISAKKAEEMAAAGVDPRKVWSETGTWKGPDGMWRQEIPDNTASITDSSTLLNRDRVGIKAQLAKLVDDVKQSGGKPTDAQKFQANMLNMRHASTSYKGDISEAFNHDGLYKAYPEMAKTPFQWTPMPVGEGAQYSTREGVLLNGGIFGKEAESLTTHELQHAIQHGEGWAKGGSPEGIANSLADEALNLRKKAREMFSAGSRAEGLALEKQARKIDGAMTMATQKPSWAYQNLAGEAEARATQARIPLDAAQRRALFPEDSYDVPINQLIVRGLLGN